MNISTIRSTKELINKLQLKAVRELFEEDDAFDKIIQVSAQIDSNNLIFTTEITNYKFHISDDGKIVQMFHDRAPNIKLNKDDNLDSWKRLIEDADSEVAIMSAKSTEIVKWIEINLLTEEA